ncbi:MULTISPECIES: nucleotidyltransferase and HEPN domain-containing protein [Ensifer]|uniref:Nucleotidyltransferase and HEPN domain-containing protein n=1 Tax=Ensifer adhaerens TaxID=106592 RepID=A0A9Q8YIZ6_ENSAD|nr:MULTISPECIES: nucleotidyltransferase and HEPN domain-containing protein [Ensifer]MBD9498270.1 HEPN domain-containing protein [Ensifer sp. ENS01]USJ28364.1 nucleotidyltransferase and HEPN domain-containing protein [Ensifer adhaerens]
MKSSLDHLPEAKRRQLARALEILREEFDDALAEGAAEFKKKGRILKVILFGSYARGDWVDEVHTGKGYRSDFDLLVIVNNRKLTDFTAYWNNAADRLLNDRMLKGIQVSLIVHSRREVNEELKRGKDFFCDIRQQGIVLYELDSEPLAEPRPISLQQQLEIAQEYYRERCSAARNFLILAQAAVDGDMKKEAAFLLHQAIEHAYSTVLLVLKNYGPPTHNLRSLRGFAEELDRSLADAWPQDRQRYVAWFNTINEAYVKARYSKHYQITDEALAFLVERTQVLHALVKKVCEDHLNALEALATKLEG